METGRHTVLVIPIWTVLHYGVKKAVACIMLRISQQDKFWGQQNRTVLEPETPGQAMQTDGFSSELT